MNTRDHNHTAARLIWQLAIATILMAAMQAAVVMNHEPAKAPKPKTHQR